MRVGPATNVARINVSEIITALWSFAHASGIKTDVITERSVNMGVTIDGLLLKNNAVSAIGKALGDDAVLVSDVAGDAQKRFRVQVDGQHEWGDGTLVRDTNLFRALADVLATNDSFRVAGVLGVIADIITERTADTGVTIDGLLVKDSGIPQAAVTAHEAALAILLGQITDGVDLTERNVAETITALWEFTHALGIKTNVITERGAGAGVTIDGLLVKDSGIDLAGNVILSIRTPAQITGNVNDYGTGTTVIQRVSASGAFSITGFAGGVDGRMIIITNIGASIITLLHISVASATENRMNLPGATNIILNQNDVAGLFYDGALSRWKAIGVAV